MNPAGFSPTRTTFLPNVTKEPKIGLKRISGTKD
jgi:hypothetical protein